MGNYDGVSVKVFIDWYTHFVYTKSITKPEWKTIENGIMGLCAEVGELANLVKKQLYQDIDAPDHELMDELGDIFWYWVYTMKAMDFDFIAVIEENIDKLNTRYPPS